MVTEGTIERSQLPAFADATEVQGTPRILDFTRPTPDGSAAFVGRLLSSPGLQEVTFDRAKIRACMTSTTDADVEESQGGPGFLANQ